MQQQLQHRRAQLEHMTADIVNLLQHEINDTQKSNVYVYTLLLQMGPPSHLAQADEFVVDNFQVQH